MRKTNWFKMFFLDLLAPNMFKTTWFLTSPRPFGSEQIKDNMVFKFQHVKFCLVLTCWRLDAKFVFDMLKTTLFSIHVEDHFVLYMSKTTLLLTCRRPLCSRHVEVHLVGSKLVMLALFYTLLSFSKIFWQYCTSIRPRVYKWHASMRPHRSSL